MPTSKNRSITRIHNSSVCCNDSDAASALRAAVVLPGVLPCVMFLGVVVPVGHTGAALMLGT